MASGTEKAINNSLRSCFFIQAHLRGTESSVPDHRNKVNIAINGVKRIIGFPMHMKVVFILYCSVLSVL